MTAADIFLEFRRIKAIEYEEKTGKSYSEEEVFFDPTYEQYQRELGIIRD